MHGLGLHFESQLLKCWLKPQGVGWATALCIISLMAADEYVVWQQLKKMKAREYICLKKKNNTKKPFFNFCFLQLLLCKHHIKYAYRDLNGSAASSGFMCSFLQGFQVCCSFHAAQNNDRRWTYIFSSSEWTKIFLPSPHRRGWTSLDVCPFG